MNIQAAKALVVQLPTDCTSTGVTGAWVDMQGFANPGGHNWKAILLCSPGSAVGTAGGRVQTADDTTGPTNLTTKVTFATQTTLGGSDEKHFQTNQRYVRFCSDTQTGKDAWLACVLIGEKRYIP